MTDSNSNVLKSLELMENLTKRQHQILRLIIDFRKIMGRFPSLQELSDKDPENAVRNSINHIVTALVKKGFVFKDNSGAINKVVGYNEDMSELSESLIDAKNLLDKKIISKEDFDKIKNAAINKYSNIQ